MADETQTSARRDLAIRLLDELDVLWEETLGVKMAIFKSHVSAALFPQSKSSDLHSAFCRTTEKSRNGTAMEYETC